MIAVEQAVKNYGRLRVLDHISFKVEEGKILGLLGVNGAGKSTTLKAITGLIRLNEGRISIDGIPPSVEVLKKIAYLPETDIFYSWMKIRDAMEFAQDFYADWNDKKANHLLDYFQLQPEQQINQLSKGMRAKLKLLMALSRQAKYLLLDEPLSGIDILSREKLIEGLMDDFTDEGQTVIITTHEVKEVENILDSILLLKDGKIAVMGDLDQLKLERNQSIVEMMREVYQ